VLRNRTHNSEGADGGKTDKRSSIERLRDFTRRLVRVPKKEIDEAIRREKDQSSLNQ
jgi:hypothetical protein